jgi:hypothetical protein
LNKVGVLDRLLEVFRIVTFREITCLPTW